MDDHPPTSATTAAATATRPVYPTEQSWWRAVPGGTGITTLALLLRKRIPHSTLQSSLRRLQTRHPILRATFTATATFLIPPPPSLTLHSAVSHSDFHSLVEDELNLNPWAAAAAAGGGGGVMHATLYDHDDGSTILVIKLHTAVCDRTAAVELVKELMHIVTTEINGGDDGGDDGRDGGGAELGLGLEEYVAIGGGNGSSKPFWARGIDMLGYSLNSFRLSNLSFIDSGSSPRSSRIARLTLTLTILACSLRGARGEGSNYAELSLQRV